MQVLPATGPRHEIFRALGGVADLRVYRPIAPELSRAVTCLEALAEGSRVGLGYGGSESLQSAALALQTLVEKLRAQSEDTGVSASEVTDYFDNPPRLREDLLTAVTEFVGLQLTAETEHMRTFSLVLFTENDFDGAIWRSLAGERPRWRMALTPKDPRGLDLHLAIVPPPSAIVGVRELAAALGCGDALPCVAFLGDDPRQMLGDPDRLVRWSARSISEPPPSVPEQLEEIYRPVFGSGGTAGASLRRMVGDRWLVAAKQRIDVRVAVILLAGALGGAPLVHALETSMQLFGKGHAS